MNLFKTVFLMTLLTLLFLFVGQLMGGHQGMVIAFSIALLMNAGTYWFSDKLVLMMYRATPLEEKENPRIYKIVRNLTVKMQVPMPKLYQIPMEAPNAFATGRNPKHAAVAATHGILRLLNDGELEGVLAHELAHVKNRDILTSTVVATVAAAIYMIADMARWAAIFGGGRDREDRGGAINLVAFLCLVILAPLAATLIQLAISRSREYGADSTGARLSGQPLALAQALRRLEEYTQRRPAELNPTTAHLFIVNPLSGRSLLRLFSTHPPLEDRIARLEKMAQSPQG